MGHQLRVREVDRLCDDAVALSFDVPDHLVADYAFEAGQFLTLRRGQERRSYSICAAPGHGLRVGVRRVEGGALSTWLTDEVRVGDSIEVEPPAGRFHTGGVRGGRHLLLAAGSGITPMIAIARSLLDSGAVVTLVYANRRTASVMFADEVADLKDEHLDRFQLVHVLSREPRDVELFSGRLDRDRLTAILDALVGDQVLDHAWLCGPWALVETAREVVADRVGAVHAELFYVEEAAPVPVVHAEPAAAGATSAVTIVLDGRRSTTALPREPTLLDAAQRVRADLPFACKGGVCGTCRARVTDGEVVMVRNYALDPAEIESGFVLACQSHSVTPEVTLDFDA